MNVAGMPVGVLLIDVGVLAIFIAILKFSLVNIVSEKRIVPEFIQYQASPARIAGTALDVLRDSAKLAELKEELDAVKKKLGTGSASRRVAAMELEMING